MPRKKMVTRTITTTKATALCLDIVAQETVKREVRIPKVFKDDKKLLKAVKEIAETDTVKVAHVMESVTIPVKYCMNEIKFMENADEIIENNEE